MDIATCLMSEDPAEITDAEDFYEHLCWDLDTQYTTVQQTEYGKGKVYDVNIYDDQYGLEYRINQHSETYFAVGRRIRYENNSNRSDICASQGEDGRYCGWLIMSYTYSLKKNCTVTLFDHYYAQSIQSLYNPFLRARKARSCDAGRIFNNRGGRQPPWWILTCPPECTSILSTGRDFREASISTV